jgi:hypothetical protein
MRAFAVSFVCVCAAVGLGACGGATTSGSQKVSVTGQVAGEPVTTTDTVAIVESGAAFGLANGQAVEIAITNVPNTCAVLQRHGDPANATSLSFGVTSLTGPVAAGTYPVVPGASGSSAASAEGGYATTDAQCNDKTSIAAASGSVTFSTISSSVVEGTFDIVLAGGDHVSGSFNAPVCVFSPVTSTQPVCGS